jgi:hypothetical protein
LRNPRPLLGDPPGDLGVVVLWACQLSMSCARRFSERRLQLALLVLLCALLTAISESKTGGLAVS